LAPTQEAVDLYRQLAAENPGYLPNLAGALNNLGISLSELGRSGDALAPTQEAVDLYRQLAAENPGYLPNLARALNNYASVLGQLGQYSAANRAWQDTLENLMVRSQVQLLLYRSQYASEGDTWAHLWLADGLAAAADERELVAHLHDEVRRHRQPDPDTFDSAWETHTGRPIPTWARLDLGLLSTVRGWLSTATYLEERDYLADHLELLDDTTDDAVDEALHILTDDEADRYRGLRGDAQTSGVDLAYRPTVLTSLAHEFVNASPADQQQLLITRKDDLLDPFVVNLVDGLVDEDETWASDRAAGLLSLTATHPPEFLDDIFTALDNPSLLPGLLRQTAETGQADTLNDVAHCGMSVATTNADAAMCGLYLAVASALGGHQDEATHNLAQARNLDPDARDSWITLIAELGQPAVLPLISTLVATSSVVPPDPTTQPPNPEGSE
jgi:tetratricopeptide (TPR) repeat protein